MPQLPLRPGQKAAPQVVRQVPERDRLRSQPPLPLLDPLRLQPSLGYLLKSSAASELLKAIQEVFEGRSYVTPLATQGLVGSFLRGPGPARPTGQLSTRQREVLQLLAEGRTMKEIAQIMKITPRTVAFHKYSMMHELGIKSSAGLVQYAVKLGVVAV